MKEEMRYCIIKRKLYNLILKDAAKIAELSVVYRIAVLEEKDYNEIIKIREVFEKKINKILLKYSPIENNILIIT